MPVVRQAARGAVTNAASTGSPLWLLVSPAEEHDQEFGIPGGKIELEYRFLDERLNRPAGFLHQVAGYPLDGSADIISIG
jgi:hypothetical protein